MANEAIMEKHQELDEVGIACAIPNEAIAIRHGAATRAATMEYLAGTLAWSYPSGSGTFFDRRAIPRHPPIGSPIMVLV